jgi:hypothetical protein
MRELDPIRRLAPPVTPLGRDEVARIRARALSRRRRPPLAGLLAPVAVAAAVLLAVVLAPGADREVEAPAPAAGDAPRLLLGGGWTVTRVDEWKPDTGEMTFARGDRELELSWMPTDRAGDLGRKPGVQRELDFGAAGGAPATVYRLEGSDDYTAVWRDGATTLSARGEASGAAAFAGLVQSLREVGVDEWRRALPPSAVTPDDRRAAVEQMVGEIPLPPGVDLARLGAATTTRDRYQLVATVAGTIACGWIAAWIDGDAPTRARAESVLGTARDWPLLHSIDAEGDYPEVLWQYADAVAGDGTVVGGKTLTVEESYQAALCP